MARERVEAPLPSQDDCYASLSSGSRLALLYLMLGDQERYLAQITNLAKACGDLINYYSENAQSLMQQMEKIMREVYPGAQRDARSEFERLFVARKQAPAGTIFGEQDIERLTKRLHEIERSQRVPIGETIHGVVCDALTQARAKHGAEVSDQALFNYSPSEDSKSAGPKT